MALTLRSAITSTETTIDVTGTDALLEGDIRQVDDEQIEVRTAYYPAGQTAYQRLGVLRGVEGTRKAAHAAAASLSTPSTGGGATPTLAEVLAEGNDPDGAAIQAAADGDGTGGRLALVAATEGGVFGGDAALLGGGSTEGNGASITAGGADDDAGFGGHITLAPGAPGGLVFLNLPTSDPAVAGALWSDGGVVTVSAG